MPTYEYACSSCQHEWELEQSIKDAAATECPTCHEQTAKRQISRGGGFILKGGGWYSDLYSSSSNKAAPSDKPAGDKAAASTGDAASKPSGDKGGTSGGGSSSGSSDSGSSSASTSGSSAKSSAAA